MPIRRIFHKNDKIPGQYILFLYTVNLGKRNLKITRCVNDAILLNNYVRFCHLKEPIFTLLKVFKIIIEK